MCMNSSEAASYDREYVSNNKAMRKRAFGEERACAIIADNLIAIAEGNAPTEVRLHLESCERCARLTRGFIRAWRDIAPPMEENVSPSFFPRLMERIDAHRGHLLGRRLGISVVRRFLRPVAVAALFAAGVFAGYEVGRIPREEAAAQEAVSPVVLAALESIPRGSVADFYIAYPILDKEEKQ